MAWYLTTQDLLARCLLRIPAEYHKGLWNIENPPLSQLRFLMSCYTTGRPVQLYAKVIPLVEDTSAALGIQGVLRAVARSEGRDDLDINIPAASSIPVPAPGDVMHVLWPAPGRREWGLVDRGKGLELPYEYVRMNLVAPSLRDFSDEWDRTYEARKAEEAANQREKHDNFMRATLALNAHWQSQAHGSPEPGEKPDADKDP